jgi:hypothetical protein
VVVKDLEFYRLLGRLKTPEKFFRISNASLEGAISYLQKRVEVDNVRRGFLNGESREMEEIIAALLHM